MSQQPPAPPISPPISPSLGDQHEPLRDLVASLNSLGVGPRDMITILQSIKAAGALQAELQVR